MQDLTCIVRAALEAYLHWGRCAIASIAEEQVDAFFLAMAQRDVAFARLVALDGQAQLGLSLDPALYEIWLQIDQVNRTLQGLMVELQGNLRRKLGGAPVLRLLRSA